MMKPNPVYTTDELLEQLLNLIKSENFSKEEKDVERRLRVYKTRIKQGNRSLPMLKAIFEHFGYEYAGEIWTKKTKE